MRRFFALLTLGFLVLQLFAGCGPGQRQYSVTYWDVFDTVTTITGFAGSQEEFDKTAQGLYEQLLRYHQLFDIYQDHQGLCNLKTVNDQAGIAPVQVDGEIIRLLKDCVEYYALTGGRVNVAMGSVLSLWHEARTQGDRLPDMERLRAAAAHTDIGCIQIDESRGTVYITDPEARLDVGAIAKGWAVQQVAEHAPEGLLLNVGGNVCATGSKQGKPWVIGIQDPGNQALYLRKLEITSGAVVTSGDYQRTYRVDGKDYHHIIDPDTLMPSTYWRSVTVVCPDSALADALSTALFLLPLEQGMALAESCGAEALWINAAGEQYETKNIV